MRLIIQKIPAFIFFLSSTIFLSIFFDTVPVITKIGLFLSLFAIRWTNLRISYILRLSLFVYAFIVVFLQLIGQDFIVINRISFFIIGIFILKSWSDEDYLVYTKLMTKFVLILLAGAVLGEIYSLNGLPGLPVHINPDGSVIALYKIGRAHV